MKDPTGNPFTTIRILVSGKVQGVFFRQSTREKAVQLGITGWVRNLPGPQVEIIASGYYEQLLELIAWCKKGPPRAIVSHLETTELSPQHFVDFIISR